MKAVKPTTLSEPCSDLAYCISPVVFQLCYPLLHTRDRDDGQSGRTMWTTSLIESMTVLLSCTGHSPPVGR